MKTTSVIKSHEFRCPSCSSNAVYKYGRIWTGKQRFICLICKRQFIFGGERLRVKDRPSCSECGNSMHIYMRGDGVIRFRCSDYPGCKTFKKISIKEE